MALLPQLLSPFQPQVVVSLDEVVVTVPREHLVEVARTLREDPRLAFDYLRCLSVVDYKDSFQIVYHLWSMEHRHKMTLKVDAPAQAAAVPSVTPVWRAADWFEREGHELFGVVFDGHPNLKPLLLWEGFEGYPGRKSYPFHEYLEW